MKLILGDCLEEMKKISDGSVDMILCDPPYGTTACKWDTIIPFEPMWKELNRIIKPNGCIALFGSEPFSSALRMSNIKNFKYDWYLEKNKVVGFLNAKKQPMRKIEICSIFTSKIYYPQGLEPYGRIKKRTKGLLHTGDFGTSNYQEFTGYPNNLIPFIKEGKAIHPTQKPVALLEYLLKTYTLEGEIVLDFTMGSGSTGVACKNLNRKFIGIEMDEKYFEIAKNRIEK